jgi:quinol monooxygenase YgiN
MKLTRIFVLTLSILAAPLLVGYSFAEEPRGSYARLAEMEIDPAQLDAFKVIADENVTATRSEPGVIAFHAFALKDNPAHIRVFEIYTDQAAYAAHLETPHYKKFRAEIQGMIKSVKLIDVTALSAGDRSK